MWFLPTIRLALSRRFFRNSHFLHSKASAAVQLCPCYSDSSCDEQVSNIEKTSNHGDNLAGIHSSRVIEILHNLRKNPSAALQCFVQFKEHGFKPDTGTYVAIIRILSYWGCDRRLDSILLEVIKSKREDLGFDVTDLFDALVEGVDVEESKLVSRALEAMIKAYISLDMFKEAIDTLLQTNRCGFGVSLRSCNSLMNRLVQCKEFDRSITIYKLFGRLDLTPDIYTYGIVIKAFCKQGSLKDAYHVFETMIKAGVSPDKFIYTILIEGLCSQGDSISGYNI